jgi:hypothetical protein
MWIKELNKRPIIMIHTCNPSYFEDRKGRIAVCGRPRPKVSEILFQNKLGDGGHAVIPSYSGHEV